MKGDFSRQTFDPRKHYSGVLMQQGRVQLDADWNEQEAIQRFRDRTTARDVIGACGAPADDPGFQISIAGEALSIGAGRYYVDGIACANETDPLDFAKQPDVPEPQDWIAEATKAKATLAIAYLDVWEHYVGALDDPRLREVALGGPDTAGRVRTVWQVKVLPVAAPDHTAELKDVAAKRAAAQKKLDKALSSSSTDPADVAKLQAAVAELDAAIDALSAPVGCATAFPEWDQLVATPVRTLNARSQPAPPVEGPCVVPPTAGYRRLENQLYRVEVHNGGAAGKATFKWSRDNGTVVTAIEAISGKVVTVRDLGPDEILNFAAGQWVELVDDADVLAGRPGELRQVDAVNSSLRQVTLKTAPSAGGVSLARNPRLRRWDQSGNTASTAGVVTATGFVALEDGVEVQFGGADYRSGDYWLIPARTATGELEWPPYEVPNQNPVAQPPLGIDHRYCRLAVLGFDAESKAWGVLEDCREIFPPLTDSCCDDDTIRVLETNWINDDLFPTAILTKDGLRVRLSAPADPVSLTDDSVQVALEMPLSANSPGATHRVYLAGAIGRDGRDPAIVVWKPAATIGSLGADRTTVGTNTGAAGASLGLGRMRVTLKGHTIWAEARRSAGRRFLDGQAFGRPALRSDGTSPRIDLVLPSGGSASASDFESWLFLGGRTKPVPVGPLQVVGVEFINAAGGLSSAGQVVPPVPAGQKVGFKSGEHVTVVRVTFNRPVLEDSLGDQQSPRLFIQRSVIRLGQVVAAPKLESENVAVLILRDPPEIPAGDFVLRAVEIVAADDGSGLDGDYDGQVDGIFQMPFTATG